MDDLAPSPDLGAGPDLLVAGQTLTLPAVNAAAVIGPDITAPTAGPLPSTYTVQPGDSLTGDQSTLPLSAEQTLTNAPYVQQVSGIAPVSGTVLRNLEIRFEGGRAVDIQGENAEALRSRVAMDEGGSRLGEVALVDREGRIDKTGTVFFNTLLDENAASHLALGNAYATHVGDADRDRINQSAIHIDFMIGSDDVTVTGLTKNGTEVPVLVGGSWQLGD